MTTDKCFEDGMASVRHDTAILGMGIEAGLSICTVPAEEAWVRLLYEMMDAFTSHR